MKKLSAKRTALVVLISSSFIVHRSSFALAAPATTQSTSEVDTLIHQLSSDNWRQRQAAQERLVVLGDEAREPLARAAKEGADDETRSRAESALAQIDENQAIGPSIITLHLKNIAPQV